MRKDAPVACTKFYDFLLFSHRLLSLVLLNLRCTAFFFFFKRLSSAQMDRVTDVTNASVLRDRGATRRNSTATPSWSCGGAADRCRVCGSMDRGCPCRKAALHVDPRTRQQNVQAVLMHTPFERMRQVRLREADRHKLEDEETRFRARLLDRMADELSAILDEFESSLRVVSVVVESSATRERLARQEAQERYVIVQAKRRLAPIIALRTANHLERLGIAAAEVNSFRRLMQYHVSSIRRIDMLDAEATQRVTLQCIEQERRASLVALSSQCKSTFGNMMQLRHVLMSTCSIGRDDIASEEAGRRQAFQEAHERAVSTVEEWYKARTDLYLQADSCFHKLASDHARHLRLMRESLDEITEYLQELRCQRERHVNDCTTQEHRQRAAVEADERQEAQDMCSERRRDFELRENAVALKKQEQRTAMHDAEAALTVLAEEGLVALAAICARETDERILCSHWTEQRYLERWRLECEAVDAMSAVYHSTVSDFSVLWDLMQEDACSTAQLERYKREQLTEFVYNALDAHSTDIPTEENDERAALYDLMLDEEERVCLWIEERASERNAAAVAEMDHRRNVELIEEDRRGKILQHIAEIVDRLQRFAQSQSEARALLLRSCIATRASLESNEEADFDVILRLEEQSYFMSLDEQNTREAVEMEHAEFSSRREVTLLEKRSRESIAHRMNIERMSLDQQAREVWLSALQELETREGQTRVLLCHSEGSAFSLLQLDAAKDREICSENEALRLLEERKQTAVLLMEDARLYDESEEPTSEGRMSLVEFRKSLRLDVPNSGRVSARQEPVDEMSLKRQFISAAIPGFDASRLPVDAIFLIAAVVDYNNDRKLAAQTQQRQIEKCVEEEHKKHEKIRQEIQRMREGISDYAAKSIKVEDESRLRRQQHKERIQREDASIQKEEARARAAASKVRQIEQQIEETKDAIYRSQGRKR